VSGPLLELRGATKRFGGITALNEVSLTVPRGGIVGVIGPNGAGKTTLFNLITGAYDLTSGEILFERQSVAGLRPHRIARLGLARTFQNIRLFPSMTVREHLLVGQRGGGLRLTDLLPSGGATRVERAELAMRRFGLEAHRDRLAATLPYGLQRKVEMARAWTAAPKLLLLDEPVAGMNHEEAQDLAVLLRALRGEGLSILLIEHDMPFVMGLCDHLHVLDFGVPIAEGTPEAVRANPVVLDAYLGASA
jgi:branched-chain amino acid transport system ATP-binding protein